MVSPLCRILSLCVLATLAGCGSSPDRVASGGATPRSEAATTPGNPVSYEVFGRTYYVSGSSEGYKERGLASWYGAAFHGKRTSSGVPYDMHAMTAAHKSLPIPTYVRVTNMNTGRSTIVKVNDRGPFKDGRIIDLSQAAAKELGVIAAGTAPVEVEALPPYQYLPGFAPGTTYLADSARDPGRARIASRPETAAPVARPTPAATPTVVALQEPMPAAPAPIARRPLPAGPSVAGGPMAPRASLPALALTSVPLPQPAVAAAPVAEPSAAGTVFLQVGAYNQWDNAEAVRQRVQSQLGAPASIASEGYIHRVRVGPFLDPHQARSMAGQIAGLGFDPPSVIVQ